MSRHANGGEKAIRTWTKSHSQKSQLASRQTLPLARSCGSCRRPLADHLGAALAAAGSVGPNTETVNAQLACSLQALCATLDKDDEV